MEKHENFFERLARERNISVGEMVEICCGEIREKYYALGYYGTLGCGVPQY